MALHVGRQVEPRLGGAAKGVSDELRERYSVVKWNEITATRDRLIHGYFDVDQDIVWQIVTVDLVPLVESLQGILGVEEK